MDTPANMRTDAEVEFSLAPDDMPWNVEDHVFSAISPQFELSEDAIAGMTNDERNFWANFIQAVAHFSQPMDGELTVLDADKRLEMFIHATATSSSSCLWLQRFTAHAKAVSKHLATQEGNSNSVFDISLATFKS